MIICFQFVFFFPFNLICIWLVEKWIFKQISRHRQTHQIRQVFLDFFVRFLRSIWGLQFGEFVQLDVACPMKPKQTTQTCASSSTASEARFINLERQGHRSGRSPRPEPLAQSTPPTAPEKKLSPSQTQFFIPLLPPKPLFQRVFLDLVLYSNLEQRSFLDKTQSRVFLEFLSNHVRKIVPGIQLRFSLRQALKIVCIGYYWTKGHYILDRSGMYALIGVLCCGYRQYVWYNVWVLTR